MDAAMTSLGEAELWFALNRLESRCWHDVDYNGGRAVHELYRSDGLFTVGKNRFEGRESIRAFYEWRRRRREMTTRHLVTNLIVLEGGETHARAAGSLMVYRGIGNPPFVDDIEPVMVGDFISDCVRGDDGAWLYASHAIDPLFMGSDVPLSLAIDPSFLATLQARDASRNPS
jgi:SnoaL-like domain